MKRFFVIPYKGYSIRIGFLCVFFWICRLSLAAPEYVAVQDRALGQSLGGASQLNDSLYTNPASSSFTQVYSIDGSLMLPRSFAVSILDTRTSSVGGSLGYFRRTLGEDPGFLQGVKLALSGKASQSIGLGIAGKTLWGPDTLSTNSRLNDLDTGVLTNFGWLQMGLTLRNILGGNLAMSQPRETMLGGRIGYMETLYLSAAAKSLLENLNPYQYGVGVEYISPYYFALKGGFRWQPLQRASYWSGGLSIISPRLSLHYAVEFPQQADEKMEHVFGLTILL